MAAIIQICKDHSAAVDLPRKLRDMIAKLKKIDDEDLLSALPHCEIARQAHLEALHVLGALEEDLETLLSAYLREQGVELICRD